MMLMPIETIPDWEMRLARQDAFWAREIVDRPVVEINVPKPRPQRRWPEKTHATIRDRWMDAQYVAETALASVMGTDYLGDGLPHVYPNLGPDVFAAFFGCELEFAEETSWSVPNLPDWSEVDRVRFREDNVYWKKIIEITDALLEVGRGRFYTGITDLHPGGDAVAAFRDPAQLNLDTIEAVAQVKELLAHVTEVYLRVYDFYHEKLRAAAQPISTWGGQVSTKKWLIPSCDFSCMISPRVFQEVFLPAVARECRHYEASLYHLDGPSALKHLDVLLEIPELTAIQWVYGAGNGRCSDWLPVYQRIQAAGKGVDLRGLEPDELDLFMENLRPEGVWLGVGGVPDRETAEAIVKKVARWR